MNGRNKAPHTYLDEIEADINAHVKLLVLICVGGVRLDGQKLTEQTALYEQMDKKIFDLENQREVLEYS